MVSRSKLRDEVVSAVMSHIRDFGLHPGDALPPERALAEEIGVSRTVVREGLTALEMQGVLELVPGRRPTVVQQYEKAFAGTLGHAVASDLRRLGELTEVRMLVEPGAAALAASRATPRDIEAMRSAVEAMERHVDSPEGYVDADTAFHEALLTASGNSLLADMLRPAAALLALSRRATSGARREVAEAVAEHRAILSAVADGDAEQARNACQAHLEATALDVAASALPR